MLNPDLFLAFVLITTVLLVTPGPIVTLVVATGAAHGIRAALAAVFGTVIGNALLLASIGFGLTWILGISTLLFEAIRWAGVAYLVSLGVQAFRNAGRTGELRAPQGRVHVWRGLVVAMSNPKTVAFFTAFLPQFVDPSLPAGVQLATMCAASVVLAAITDSAWAVAAGLGRRWFLAPERARVLGRASGAVLVGGGIWLALSRRPG